VHTNLVNTWRKQLKEKGHPDIFNTDQGSQFTAHAFTSRLQADNIRITPVLSKAEGMDG